LHDYLLKKKLIEEKEIEVEEEKNKEVVEMFLMPIR
jgi:hypothetical protein